MIPEDVEMRVVLFPVLLIVISMATVACATVPIPTSPAGQFARATAAPQASPVATLPSSVPFATRPPIPRVVRINIGTRPETLDPQRASTSSEFAVLQLAYEGLTRIGEKGEVVSGAAETWEFSNEGKTLTFHLRAGRKRADGTPITARDFEYAFKRAVDPRVVAQSQSFLDDVHGAVTAYSMDGKSKPEDIEKVLDSVGVKATDDLTLVVSFDQPTGYWTTIASTGLGLPSDRSRIEKDPGAWWLKPENHNGNGPFKIAEIQEQVIKLVPNPNYRDGKAKLDRIEFYWLTDAAGLEVYRQGGLEITPVTAENLAPVQSDPTLSKELRRAPAPRVTYLGFNTKRAPFNDKNVRKAFSQALDRESFVRDVLKGLGKPQLSWIPPGIPGYDETAAVPGYDPKAAVQTLIDGGYGTPDKKKVDCAKLGTIKLTYSNTARTQPLFSLIAGNLTRVFACPVLLDPVEPTSYSVVTRDPKTIPQVYLISWDEEYPHPQNWLFLQTCAGVFATRLGYCNREFDVAFAAANQETDFDKAVEKYQAAQKIFIGDVVGAFLWNNENAYLIKPYVLGVWDHHSTADKAYPGQFGPVLSYDIDLGKTGVNYPLQ
jgi:oligopeptide transport system substrate-binding protein